MKKAKINVEQFVETPSMQIAKDLGLAEDDVTSIQSKLLGVEEKEEKLPFLRISKCAPYCFIITEENLTEGKPPIATLMCLCTNEIDKELFILYHNYIIESAEELDILRENPLNIDFQIISNSLLYYQLNNLKKYNTEFNLFTVDKDDEDAKDTDKFYMLGYCKEDNNNLIKIYLNYQMMNILMFADNFIVETDPEQYQEQLMQFNTVMYAEGFVPDFEEIKCDHIFVDDIVDVVYLYCIDKKSGDYEVAFRMNNPFSKSETDKFFTVGKYISIEDKAVIKKLRPNATDEKIQEVLKGKDKFKPIYDYICTIDDKNYIMLKVINTDETNKIEESYMLFLDTEIDQKLEDLIIKNFSK